MTKRRTTRHTPEFRDEALKAVAARPDRTIAQVAEELGIPNGTLAHWHAQAQKRKRAAAAEEAPPLSETERAELERLRRDNARLRTEREILKKATAFFASESD